jgi:hypothetical protein
MASISDSQGDLHSELANDISSALTSAEMSGLNVDQALGVVLGVVSDYGRAHYGDAYILDLAALLLHYGDRPLLGDVGRTRSKNQHL